jgi:hypothetical protein
MPFVICRTMVRSVEPITEKKEGGLGGSPLSTGEWVRPLNRATGPAVAGYRARHVTTTSRNSLRVPTHGDH